MPLNENLNTNLNIKKKDRKPISYYLDGIAKQDFNIISQTVTLVESHQQDDFELAQDILKYCMQLNKKSRIIGITGIPGVGKSTFIEAFGNTLMSSGETVAVIAVDPSSSISGGSILGDKTRMKTLSESKNAFIRPSPSQGVLGGVAQKTHEVIAVFEASGFDTILVETVGVGQSEAMISEMVDFFILLTLANTGDDLQGIKRGILEQAHSIVFTKNDGMNFKQTDLAFNELKQAIKFIPQQLDGWSPRFCKVSSLEGTGLENVRQIADEFFTYLNEHDLLLKRRERQKIYWFENSIDYYLKRRIRESKDLKLIYDSLLNDIMENKMSPNGAAKKLLELILSQK